MKSIPGAVTKVVVADCKYGTTENFVELGEMGIVTHMGDLRARLRNHKTEGIFDQSHFRYDRKRDVYTCPVGEQLSAGKSFYERGYTEYAAKKGVCSGCFLKAQCTRSKTGRTINRYPLQETLDRARKQSASKRGIEDRKRRQHFQERNFADAANQHGYKRSRWRGLWRQQVQDYLIAGLQNLRLLIRLGKEAFGGELGHLRTVWSLLLASLFALFALSATNTPSPTTMAAR